MASLSAISRINMIRVTIGLAEENQLFLHALKQVLSSFERKAQPSGRSAS